MLSFNKFKKEVRKIDDFSTDAQAIMYGDYLLTNNIDIINQYHEFLDVYDFIDMTFGNVPKVDNFVHKDNRVNEIIEKLIRLPNKMEDVIQPYLENLKDIFNEVYENNTGKIDKIYFLDYTDHILIKKIKNIA